MKVAGLRVSGLKVSGLKVSGLRVGLFYQYDFGSFVFEVEAYGFEAFVDLALHGFVHRFAFDRGIFPFQFLDLFLQLLDAPHAFFGKMGVGDIDDAQETEEHQVLKVAEHQVGGVLADVERGEQSVCHINCFWPLRAVSRCARGDSV